MEKYYLYIVLTRTNTLISKLIQIIKNDEYTHAAISLDKELKNIYSFGRKTTYNPFFGTFRKEDLNEGVYKFCNTLPGVIIEVEVSREQYEKAKSIINHFIKNRELYKYNYKGLVYSLINKAVKRDDRFLCSEFVYYILKESGTVELNIPRNLVRPQSLLNIGRIVYRGNLKEIISPENKLYTKEININLLKNTYLFGNIK